MKINHLTKPILLFVFAQILTFGFITLLQFVEGVYFVLTLILMHVGIVTFILARKQFKRQCLDVSNHFKIAYFFLALYLPVLIYKLMSLIFLFTQNDILVMTYVLSLTGLAVIAGLLNTLILIRNVKQIKE
jgi:hypothetical protein